MSEMEWEEAPEVSVPLVRKRLGRAVESWTRGCYPRRRGVFVWGWFIPIWGIAVLFKFAIYATGIVLILLANVVWVAADLLTYRRRLKRAALRVWGPYMGELHGQDPPPFIA